MSVFRKILEFRMERFAVVSQLPFGLFCLSRHPRVALQPFNLPTLLFFLLLLISLQLSGTRTLGDNLSDLKAQVAANHKGILLIEDLVAEHSLPVVQAYMGHVQVSGCVCARVRCGAWFAAGCVGRCCLGSNAFCSSCS